MSEAEEDNIALVKGHLAAEALLGIAQQALMDITEAVAGIALRMGKDNLRLRMVYQQTYQFSACITGCTENTNPNHLCSSLWIP